MVMAMGVLSRHPRPFYFGIGAEKEIGMRISKTVERKFFVPKDPDGAWVMIKHLKPGEIQDIMDDVMVQEISYREVDGKLVPKMTQTNDRRKDRERTVLEAVTGWGNFYDEPQGKAKKGQPLVFSEANVLRAIKEIDGFTEFVAECRATLAKDIASEYEAQEKN
jgi:hypothetical protein